MNTKTPPVKKRVYNQSLSGIYGEFGSGANSKIMFVQTAIRPADLGKATLISDIPGSETWPVPDLFQREVDLRRITKSLLPYLQDRKKVKFFNPLTLSLLPFDPEKREVLTSLPSISETDLEEDGQKWRVIEIPGYYKYKHIRDQPAWGELEWNDAVVKLVAIDGQHRLSALKRFQADPKDDKEFQGWSIPAVVIAFRDLGGSGTNRVLEVVRSIFIYINTEARIPNRARRILLSDESINSICTQELVQLSHSNDVLEEQKRDRGRVPLLFYDWRGEEDEGRRVMAPAAVKMIEEITDWLETYIAGEDFTQRQEVALGVQPVDAVIKRAFVDRRLDPEASRLVRDRVRLDLVRGVGHLIEQFGPYKQYIAALRELEKEYMAKSDIARHAFHKLRFGSHQAGPALHGDVERMYEELLREIVGIRTKFVKPPLNLDVGMRGVVCAFGELRELYSAAIGKAAPWLAYSGWFVESVNTLYGDGWLDGAGRPDVRALLRHVIQDHNENVINYRLEDASDALGAYVQLMVCAFARRKRGLLEKKDAPWKTKREDLMDRLGSCVMRGYRKEVRPLLREEYPKGGRELTEAVNKEAEKRTRKHLKKLDDAVDAIARS